MRFGLAFAFAFVYGLALSIVFGSMLVFGLGSWVAMLGTGLVLGYILWELERT